MTFWLLLVIAGLSRLPPNFPELPSNYTEWADTPCEHAYFPLRLIPPIFKMKACNKDSITLSFSIEDPEFKKAYVASDTTFAYGYARYIKSPTANSAFGYVKDGMPEESTSWVAPATASSALGYVEGGMAYVFWRSGEKVPLNPVSIRDCLIYGLNLYHAGVKLALNKTGVEGVIISDHPSFRLRAMWWRSQCDGSIHDVGSATCYFVPAEDDEKHEFIILCLTRTYHRSPPFAPLEEYTQEEADSIRANWEYEKTYPNNIAELERAVEQSFRVKE